MTELVAKIVEQLSRRKPSHNSRRLTTVTYKVTSKKCSFGRLVYFRVNF